MKQKIINELSKVKRNGIKDLINYLKTSDFFIAPCSIEHHNNFKRGLAIHSWNVYKLFKEKCKRYNLNLKEESIVICSLLHDICKVDFYKRKVDYVEFLNYPPRITPIGLLEKYEIDDEFPIGHGEKSVIVIQKFIKLTDEEICIIRWHMSNFGDDLSNPYHKNAYYKAVEMCPAIVLLFTADYEATTFLEKTNR